MSDIYAQDQFLPNQEYIELLKKARNVGGKLSNTALSDVRKRLTDMEIRMTSEEIIKNTKLAIEN